jgi:hypothetical protein
MPSWEILAQEHATGMNRRRSGAIDAGIALFDGNLQRLSA